MNMIVPILAVIPVHLPQGEPIVITDEADEAKAVVSQVTCFNYAIKWVIFSYKADY